MRGMAALWTAGCTIYQVKIGKIGLDREAMAIERWSHHVAAGPNRPAWAAGRVDVEPVDGGDEPRQAVSFASALRQSYRCYFCRAV